MTVKLGNFITESKEPPDEQLPHLPESLREHYKLFVGGGLAGNLFSGHEATDESLQNDRLKLKRVGQESLIDGVPPLSVLKYVHARDDSEGVYFRGQRSIYGTLKPTLYREIVSQAARDKRDAALKDALWAVRSTAEIFQKFGSYAHEPLLQHYGISTTWIDLVDNVWVALWFACNRAIISGRLKDHMHFEKRIPSTDDQYAFILFVAADIASRNRKKPGYYFGPKTELVDLRMAAPSIFLRPHSQHGLLFRQKPDATSGRLLDYSGQLRGIVAVELSKALDWLGTGVQRT